MPISERRLKKWRKEALKLQKEKLSGERNVTGEDNFLLLIKQILELTQELLDQHLMKK